METTVEFLYLNGQQLTEVETSERWVRHLADYVWSSSTPSSALSLSPDEQAEGGVSWDEVVALHKSWHPVRGEVTGYHL